VPAVLFMACDPDVAAAQAPRTDVGLRASVGITMTPNRLSGATGGTAVSDDMRPGESSRLNLATGDADDLCAGFGWAAEGAPPPEMQTRVDEREARASYVWRFDVTVVEAITDRITFDLAWRRTSRAASEGPIGQRQRMTLREGEMIPIDLVRGAPGADCASVALQVTARIVDEVVERKTIAWDLWFDRGDRSEPTRISVTSLHGDGATFAFEPLRAVRSSDGAALWISVHGQLRGRLLPDGRLDVALNTRRTVSSGSKPDATSSARLLVPAGGSGQKHFTLAPGEAVKIVLPPVRIPPAGATSAGAATSGGAATAGTPSSSAEGEMAVTIRARIR
jgi:hypothetical protein